MSELLHRCSLCHQIITPTGTAAVPVDAGAQLVAQAGKTLQEILDGIDQVQRALAQLEQPQEPPRQQPERPPARGAARAVLRLVT